MRSGSGRLVLLMTSVVFTLGLLPACSGSPVPESANTLPPIAEPTRLNPTHATFPTPTPDSVVDSGFSETVDTLVRADPQDCRQTLDYLLHAAPVDGWVAFVDECFSSEQRLTVVGLARGDAKISTGESGYLNEWSPSGAYLLAGQGVYRNDGERVLSLEAPDSCKRPFWAPPGAFAAPGDRLICQVENGRLDARLLPGGEVQLLLPSGSLTPGTQDTVLLSDDGDLAWTPGLNSLADAKSWAQKLYLRSVDANNEPTILHLSDDIREIYYRPVDWVPGTRLILAGRGRLGASLWVDGVPLVAIDADTGEIRDLGVTMLLTPEAYDWHPSRPGLLALAAGSGRFINENKRLVLLDIAQSEYSDLTYLTGEEYVVFAPSWSPDGTRLAYAAASASPGLTGDGEMLERTLVGRAIYVIDPETRDRRALTEPDEVIDGWPHWSADGQHLLYTRQQEGHVDVRVVATDGSSDDLLLTGLPDPLCVYGGCGWNRMLAYAPGMAPPQLEKALPPDFPEMDLLLADSEGRLILYALPFGKPQPLTESGAFYPGMGRPLWTPPQPSPDGTYWLLPQPNGLGTWLVSSQQESARKIDERSLMTTWSPESDRLAYAWEADYAILDVGDGQENAAVSHSVQGDGDEKILALAWSPTTDWIALLVKSSNGIGESATLTILLAEPTEGALETVGDVSARATESTALELAWSPDEQAIEWFGAVDAPDTMGIAWPVDGGAPRALLFPELPPGSALTWRGYTLSVENGGPPVPSPDGKWLAWCVVDQNRTAIWRQPVDASTPAEVVAELPTPVWHLVWAPDGRYLIAAGDWSSLAPVWAVAVESGAAYQLADEALLLNLPPASLRPPPHLLSDGF